MAMPTLASLLFPLYAAALGTIDCSKMLADKHNFDLSALDGPHSVMHSVEQPPSWLNTTYTINICRPLVPDSNVKKDERCPGPTRGLFPRPFPMPMPRTKIPHSLPPRPQPKIALRIPTNNTPQSAQSSASSTKRLPPSPASSP